jgi:hypothetical protein
VQKRTGRIMKASDFAACEDETTNGVWIARSAFQAVPKVDCAQFILVVRLMPLSPTGTRTI